MIPDWINLSMTSGSGDKIVNVVIAPNTGAARACTLKVGEGERKKTLSITQEAYVPPTPSGSKIYYTSTDGKIVTPKNTTGWTANIVSNTYADGRGCLVFDGEVTEIPFEAFRNCSLLESINIPSSVTSIGVSAFAFCTSLKGVAFPKAISEIKSEAFMNCTSITEITFPDIYQRFGSKFLYGCTSLTRINMTCDLVPMLEDPSIGGWFDNTNNCPIYVPCGMESTYKSATNWSAYAGRIVGDCPQPTGDTHYLASNLGYDITVKITDDGMKTIVPATTLVHNDSISWEGNDSIVIRITSPTSDTVRVRDDSGDFLTGNITLTPNVEASSPKIVMTGIERIKIVSILLAAARPSAGNETNDLEEEILEENDIQELQDTL